MAGAAPGTVVGIVGGNATAVVDDAGTVGVRTAGGTAATVEWWVGADDRWHRAPIEAAVRQRLDDDLAIETRLRVPGGDVAHRVAAVPLAGSVGLRVACTNHTPVPVAIAVVVSSTRPLPIDIDDDTIRLAGEAVVRLGRPIARAVIGDDVDEVSEAVEAGRAVPPTGLTPATPGAVVVAIVPLPHTATRDAAIAATPPGAGLPIPGPAALPPFDAIARGWDAHLGAAARLGTPDDRLDRAVAAARRHLVVTAGAIAEPGRTPVTETEWGPAVVVAALDAWGHHDAALDVLLRWTGPDDLVLHATRPVAEAGSLMWAWAQRLERHPDAELATTIASFVEQAAIGLLHRRRRLWFGRRRHAEASATDDAWRAVGLASAASVLSRAGETTAGADIVDALPDLVGAIGAAADVVETGATVALALGGRRLGARGVGSLPTVTDAAAAVLGRAPSGDLLASLVAASSPTGALGSPSGTHSPLHSAMLLVAVAAAVVDEPDGAGGPVAVFPGPDRGWLGGAVEAHDMPVSGGTVSAALRWHGDRPALLWEITASREIPALTCPALDGEWSVVPGPPGPTGTRTGEALLAPTPGLVVDVVESPVVLRGERVDASAGDGDEIGGPHPARRDDQDHDDGSSGAPGSFA